MRSASGPGNRTGLILLGSYKLLEGLVLVAVGFGIHRLMNRDLSDVILHWVRVLRIDPDNRYIHQILSKVLSVSPAQLREIRAGTFLYAALRFGEGIGLLLRKRWGEYLTIVSTALFIPLEIIEVLHHATSIRVAVFAINVATLWYLIAVLRQNRSRR